MKVSLAWLFDHIDADWRSIDIAHVINLFNKKTAEIEGFEKVAFSLDHLAAGKVIAVNDKEVSVEIPEWKKKIVLPARHAREGDVFLISNKADYAWATLADVASQKEGLLPALDIPQKTREGAWKKNLETTDYILHVDNKSINHRPDMWGHRGIAREIAVLLDLKLKPLDDLLQKHAITSVDGSTLQADGWTVDIKDLKMCHRFAGLALTIDYSPSLLPIALRLARVDSRPINAIVDLTNYVMLDIGQPMHAFDSPAFKDNTVIIRPAKNKETLSLLDGQTITLTDQDCVVANSDQPLALAGIMGGDSSKVTSDTKNIFLEAACFGVATIRKTTTRIKKRTESSARFEKSLDPKQGVLAIQRFLKLLSDSSISYTSEKNILSVGQPIPEKTITITHERIEQLLGVSLNSDFIIKTLNALGFSVKEEKKSYQISVPSFRATKDIAIPEDIVEEIGRIYGYDALAEVLPYRPAKPFDLTAVMRERKIKQLLAYGWQMQEIYGYAFFDESMLKVLDWDPGATLTVQSAVSQNWQRLVTTLVPNLLKAVNNEIHDFDQLSFFEWAAVWPEGKPGSERSCLSGIWTSKKTALDFYTAKSHIDALGRMLGVSWDWKKANAQESQPWYLSHETADFYHEGVKIGTLGKANPAFIARIASFDACIFECNGEWLMSHSVPTARYQPASKYPAIVRDVSALVPISLTVEHISHALQKLDTKITDVTLVDFFQKADWLDKKSLTFRISMGDSQATMSSAQADAIIKSVTDYLQSHGAQIR